MNDEVKIKKVNQRKDFEDVSNELLLLADKAKKLKTNDDLRSFKREIELLKIKNKDNESNYRKILQFMYARNMLRNNNPELNVFNEMEAKECNMTVQQINALPSAGIRCEFHRDYPARKYFDETKQVEVYTFFVDVSVSPDEQISRELNWKIRNGFMPEQKDFSPERRIWKRYSLNEKEFFKYFQVVSE